MNDLMPLETLFDAVNGVDVPLPDELARLYGPFGLPSLSDQTYVVANFVTTLDGVVSLNLPGQSGGGPISGFNRHDRMVMGLLRAVADAVIVGAGTVRAVSPEHVWNAEYIYPPLAAAYRELRDRLLKQRSPLNVVVTARGELDLNRRVFRSGDVPVLIVTTEYGAQRMTTRLPSWVRVAVTERSGPISARSVLAAVRETLPSDVVLLEGGPQLLGDFFAEECLDELFMTLAPQVAGRDRDPRPPLVAGKQFAPERPLWGTLTNLKRGGSHLFMRYRFDRA